MIRRETLKKIVRYQSNIGTLTNGFSGFRVDIAVRSAALFAAGMCITTQAFAGPLVIEEVTVTAQKRNESLESVPISVSALGGDMVSNGQIQAVADLEKFVPSASIGRSEGQNRMFLRGVGFTVLALGSDASVAFHSDGVIMSRPSVQLSAFYDIERIEVLRGPQGSLYGRNATAGSVNVITRGPTENFEAHVAVSFGNYEEIVVEGAISGPLGETGILSRLAFKKFDRNEGYGKNIVLDKDMDDADTLSLRWKTLFPISEDAEFLLNVDYHREDDNNYAAYTKEGIAPFGLVGEIFGGSHTGEPFKSAVSTVPINDREFWGVSGTFDWALGDQWSVKSITGYRESDRTNSFDVGGSNGLSAASLVFRTEMQHQFTQELQLSFTSDRLTALFGACWHEESVEGGAFLDLDELCPDCVSLEQGEVDIKALGLFAQLNYSISDNLNLTVGLRYSDEERDTTGHFGQFKAPAPEPVALPLAGQFGPVFCAADRTPFLFFGNFCQLTLPSGAKDDWQALTPEVKLDYTFEDGTMVFASVAKGFKSGLVSIGSANPPVDPEFVKSYEIGLKTRLLDDRMRLDVTGFYYDYTDLQLGVIRGPSVVTENAGEATIKGVEFELHALLTEELTLNASGAWIDAKYDRYSSSDPIHQGSPEVDLSGNQLSNSPKYSFNLGFVYERVLESGAAIELSAQAAWKDEIFFDSFNRDNLKSDPYVLVDTYIAYTTADEHWRIGLYGRNLFDKTVPVTGSIGAGFMGLPVNHRYNDPRTYGIRIKYQY